MAAMMNIFHPKAFKFWISEVMTYFTGVIGVVANIITLMVLFKM